MKQLKKVVDTLTKFLEGGTQRQTFKTNYDKLKVKKSYKFSSTPEEKNKNQERTLDEEQEYQFLKKYLFAFFDETKEAKIRRVLNAKQQELEASQKEKETLGKCLDEQDKTQLEQVKKKYEELNTKNQRNAAQEQEFVELNKTTRAQTATENDSPDVQKYENLTSKKEAIKNKIDERLKVVFDETVYNEKGFVQKGDDSLWGKIKYHLPTYKKPFYTSLLLAVYVFVFGFLLSLVLLAVKNKSTLSRTNNVFVKGVKQVGSKFVDKGQVEAAQSLGLNKKQTFYYVTFPQALKKSVPLVVAQFVTNIKACTFFVLIALIDMSFVTNDAMNVTGDLVAPFVILSFVYLVLIQFINMLSKYLEKN
ncbi:ABC transporter permease subunit [Candidatus Phytoplasma asteris]|uniref:ABC transporter permease subunit n=1 Tax=Candidatus Phytoplasma asteris TaxID=85620 RepID=UPI0039DFDEBE